MQGSATCCHEHFVVVSDVNNGVMIIPSVNKGHDDVRATFDITMVWNVVKS